MEPPHIAAPQQIRTAHDAEALKLKSAIEEPDARKERQHERRHWLPRTIRVPFGLTYVAVSLYSSVRCNGNSAEHETGE